MRSFLVGYLGVFWMMTLPRAWMLATSHLRKTTTTNRYSSRLRSVSPSRVPEESAHTQNDADPIKVIVIGAGFSGLSVAYHLMKLSKTKATTPLHVEILEGRDRIGGRVQSFCIDDDHGDDNNNNDDNDAPTYIDLGGQWVHEASPSNPIRRLMEDDLDLAFVSAARDNNNNNKHRHRFQKRDRENVLFDQTGSPVPQGIARRARRLFYKAMGDLVDDHEDLDDNGYVHHHRVDRTGVSYGELLESRLQLQTTTTKSTTKSSSRLFESVVNYFVHRSEENEGGKLEQVSAVLANNLYDDDAEGPDRVVHGSYKSILDGLVAKLNLNLPLDEQQQQHEQDTFRVRLRKNTKVERIRYGTSSETNDNPKVSVTIVDTDSGNGTATVVDLDADICVCTVPLGVLQQGTIDFVPTLPPQRQEAIDGIGMGLLNKIVFRFDGEQKFWGDLEQFGICHEDPSRIKTYYDCTDDYYYTNKDGDTNASNRSAILVQFLAGAAADRLDPPLSKTTNQQTIGITDEEAISESLEALRSVFGSDKVPDPSVAKVTRWREDPWSRGSYSFAKVGSSAWMYDEVAAPLGTTGRLLFAGEHTSKHFHSTVHGAWESGRREAERIITDLVHSQER